MDDTLLVVPNAVRAVRQTSLLQVDIGNLGILSVEDTSDLFECWTAREMLALRLHRILMS